LRKTVLGKAKSNGFNAVGAVVARWTRWNRAAGLYLCHFSEVAGRVIDAMNEQRHARFVNDPIRLQREESLWLRSNFRQAAPHVREVAEKVEGLEEFGLSFDREREAKVFEHPSINFIEVIECSRKDAVLHAAREARRSARMALDSSGE